MNLFVASVNTFINVRLKKDKTFESSGYFCHLMFPIDITLIHHFQKVYLGFLVKC